MEVQGQIGHRGVTVRHRHPQVGRRRSRIDAEQKRREEVGRAGLRSPSDSRPRESTRPKTRVPVRGPRPRTRLSGKVITGPAPTAQDSLPRRNPRLTVNMFTPLVTSNCWIAAGPISHVELVMGEVEQPSAVSAPETQTCRVIPGRAEGSGRPMRGDVEVGLAALGDRKGSRCAERRAEEPLNFDLREGRPRREAEDERRRTRKSETRRALRHGSFVRWNRCVAHARQILRPIPGTWRIPAELEVVAPEKTISGDGSGIGKPPMHENRHVAEQLFDRKPDTTLDSRIQLAQAWSKSCLSSTRFRHLCFLSDQKSLIPRLRRSKCNEYTHLHAAPRDRLGRRWIARSAHRAWRRRRHRPASHPGVRRGLPICGRGLAGRGDRDVVRVPRRSTCGRGSPTSGSACCSRLRPLSARCSAPTSPASFRRRFSR